MAPPALLPRTDPLLSPRLRWKLCAISEEEYLAGLRTAGLVDVEVRDGLVYDADQLAAVALEAASARAPADTSSV